MYLLYLDDSGSPRNRKEGHFVLGGVCIHERKTFYINKYLDRIAERLNPDNPSLIEFHAAEIFSGRKGIWSDIEDKTERIQIIKDVLNVLNEEASGTCVFACAVHKASYPHLDPVKLAFEDLCSRFALFLKRMHYAKTNNNREHGLIILDKSTYETSIQTLSRNFRKEGTRWGTDVNFIDEVPFFVDSKASRIVQLADHIAYAVFRRYESKDLNYFDIFQGRFDRDENRIHGLVHKQNDIDCLCPACITRGNS